MVTIKPMSVELISLAHLMILLVLVNLIYIFQKLTCLDIMDTTIITKLISTI